MERDGLTLHVRAHQGPGSVVVLQEQDQRGRDRHHLARRDVHVLDLASRNLVGVAVLDAHQDVVLDELALRIERGVRLRDDIAVLFVGRQVVDLIGDVAGLHLAVGGLDEAERVDAREGRQRAIEPMFGPSGVSMGHMRP